MTGPLPSFIHAGAGRAGSTYIHTLLAAHPDVFVPPTKDLYFFDQNYARGLAWYARFFRDARPGQVPGEVSMSYYVDPEVPARIRAHLPEAKLIFCLREPVARAFSHYYWEMLTFHHVPRRAFADGLTFAEFARCDRIFPYGDYYTALRRFFDVFPAAQIKVVFFEELQRDPDAVYRALCTFLDVDPGRAPAAPHAPVNAGRAPRFPRLAEAGYRVLAHARARGRPGPVSTLRDSRWFNRVMFRPLAKDPAVLAAARPELWPLYHARDRELEALIGRDLPAEWRA